ncbi:hypothetical protein, partial [Pseudomonas hunanensis]|uniref:hypothetical protein n=1 Tax=Pseudomonas hunanensis TaxID=1247546 RepID=UPI00286A0B8D
MIGKILQLFGLGKSILSELCQRTGTGPQDEGQGHRKKRFIRMMFGTSRDYGKNVGGSNRPFFLSVFQVVACQDFEDARCFAVGVFVCVGDWAWFWSWACRLGAYSFDVAAPLAPSALTTGHFVSWKKVTKNRLLLHPAPTLRCGVPSLRSCSGR